MRIEDIPSNAWTAPSTPVPTKVETVYDWQALYKTMQEQGFVIIETDQLRKTPNGSVESIQVKCFNSYLSQTLNIRLKTKRISVNRWFCTADNVLNTQRTEP